MVSTRLGLGKPIAPHEIIDEIAPLLSVEDCTLLALMEPFLQPFMTAQNKLYGDTYVTEESSMILTIAGFREGSKHTLQDLNEAVFYRSLASVDQVVAAASASLIICADALHEDLTHHWGDRRPIFQYKQGRHQATKIFKVQQVLATVMYPRGKHLHGTRPEEDAAVWRHVAKETVQIAKMAKSGGVAGFDVETLGEGRTGPTRQL